MSEPSMPDLGPEPWGRERVLALPLTLAVKLYQVTISPMLGPVCRYHPSCSHYSVTALERFGPVKGTWLTAWRLLRCNPWAAGGVDDVPPRQPQPTRPRA